MVFSVLSVDEILRWERSETSQMKATEQYFPVVLVIMLYKVVLTFESVHKILRRNHPNGAFY